MPSHSPIAAGLIGKHLSSQKAESISRVRCLSLSQQFFPYLEIETLELHQRPAGFESCVERQNCFQFKAD